jgi:L-amino acid N-acyltransferase YncA
VLLICWTRFTGELQLIDNKHMFSFAPVQAAHWEKVKAIYEAGIATGQATFQTAAPGWEEWDEGHLQHSRILALEDGKIVGWAALAPVSKRPVYAGVAEVSVYIDAEARGKGIGKALLKQLVQESERHGIWTLYASIFPENAASVAIHKANGFREIGFREKIAKMNGVWRDTVILERRSKTIGYD